MVTNNAINSQDPIEAAKGGTGLATITDHCVLVGSGTDPITPLTAATNGQLVIGSTGVDPAVAALASADSSVIITNTAGGINLEVTGKGVIQEVSTSFNSYVLTTVNMPADTTKPQNDEGTEIITLAITPTSATNILEIQFISDYWHNTRTGFRSSIALFQDATADALCANTFERIASLTTTCGATVNFKYRMVSGTTSETTFKIRIGSDATYDIDNYVGSHIGFNGVELSYLMIKEYSV